MHAGSILVALPRAVVAGDMPVALLKNLTKERSSGEGYEVLDFKQQLPVNDLEYSKTIRDLVALHNSYGGFIVLGVRELERDREIEVVGVQSGYLQLDKLRDTAFAVVCEKESREAGSILGFGHDQLLRLGRVLEEDGVVSMEILGSIAVEALGRVDVSPVVLKSDLTILNRRRLPLPPDRR